MTHFKCFRCVGCGAEYARDEARYICPVCGKDYQPGMPLPGVLEARFDYAGIASDWAKKPDLNLFNALDPEFYPPLPVGNTPLFQAGRMARDLDLPHLYIKNDGLNPSGSLKDRASQLVVAEANRLGVKDIVCASTGNAASSLACLCASAGKTAVIFAPASAPAAKLAQIRVHGAQLHLVDGTYDDAFRSAMGYSSDHDCLNRNTAYHPFTIEGKKTAGLEIFIQLGNAVPDWIVVPVGDGVILSGIYKAFYDLKQSGLIAALPRLLAVQAESSDAITAYWESGVYRNAAIPCTAADSISVRTPSNAHLARQALLETNGKALRVSDAEILLDQNELARQTGVFAEPSCAATLSGLKKALALGWIERSESVVLLITGHGLKDISAVR